MYRFYPRNDEVLHRYGGKVGDRSDERTVIADHLAVLGVDIETAPASSAVIDTLRPRTAVKRPAACREVREKLLPGHRAMPDGWLSSYRGKACNA